MSQNSDGNRNTLSFNPYVQQNLLTSDDEEESATLAEPMTLEGAKQLAQSTPTPTPPLSHSLHGTVSPSPLSSPTSPLTLHHNISSPLHSLPSTRAVINSSPSPGIGHNSTPSPIANHLSSPPHLATLNHHHSHNLWPPPSSHVEPNVQDESELPSTVDIQAIRDSPSPDPSAGKLMTINENWDSLEDQQETSFEGQLEVEDSCDEEESSDSSDSDSESVNSHCSSRSDANLANMPCNNNYVSDYDSDSNSAVSKSDSGDSQDSDSDNSDCSSTDGESNGSSADDDDGRIMLEAPLPRRKPQLTASNIKLSESSVSSKDVAINVLVKSKLSDLKTKMCHQNIDNKCDYKVEILANKNKENHHSNLPIKMYPETSKVEFDKFLKPMKSKSVDTNLKLIFKEETLNYKESLSLKATSDPLSDRKQHKKINNSDHHLKEYISGSNKNVKSHMLNSDSISVIPRLKLESNSHSEINSKVNIIAVDLQEKDIPSTIYNWKLEKRRLKKKQEMEIEFDRLLKSSNQFITDETNEINKESAKETYHPIEKKSLAIKNKLLRLDDLYTSMNSESILDNKSDFDYDSDKRTSNSNIPPRVSPKTDQFETNKYKSDVVKNNDLTLIKHNLCKAAESYYQRNIQPLSAESKNDLSSDSKSIELSSTSSSENEDILPKNNCKRAPCLNVTAKVIGDPIHLKNSFKSSSMKYFSSAYKNNKILSCSEKPHDILIHPTIADIVKVRERRKGSDREGTLSESEKSSVDDTLIQISRQTSKEEEDDATSSSETFDDLNEKIDVDTEQTQTFSVSESNFNQGRLTMRIAAMKMAKFGRTGLKEVMASGIPTRSEINCSKNIFLSPHGFKMPRNVSYLKSKAKQLVPKVKTAAERKTYVDALPPTGAVCLSTRGRYKVGVLRSELRETTESIYRGSSSNGLGCHPSSNAQANRHQALDVNDEISKIAQSLSQISNDQLEPELLSNGLQVLDQDDLAAILPDVCSTIGPLPEDKSSSLDPFRDEFAQTNNSDSDDDLSSSEDTSPESENLFSIIAENNNTDDFNNDYELENSKNLNRSFQCSRRHSKRNNDLGKTNNMHHSDSPKRRQSKRRNCDPKDADDAMPELESYVPLDCNVSNVSPDSGIQSVNGSPVHAVCSPAHHSMPFYSVGTSDRPNRSFSPSDSPPPPTLVPVLTPPHYNYEAPSPPMPSLTCQIDLLPWKMQHEEKSSDEAVMKLKDLEKPEDNEAGEANIKRRRGRPKGSKNRKKCSELDDYLPYEENQTSSFILEPSNSLAKFNQVAENEESTNSPDYSAMRHKWRGSTLDIDDMPLKQVKRGPGRPKKNLTEVVKPKPRGRPKVIHKISAIIDTAVTVNKRPVGRPRKIPQKIEDTDKIALPNYNNNKCFSERIMHRIINEKIRNSEKSDKLCVHEEDIRSDDSAITSVRELSERRAKIISRAIILDDRRRKRGRRKKDHNKLPKIFEKVYGNIENDGIIKPDSGKVLGCIIARKKKKKHKTKFKSKHKNIIDPIFLAEVDKLSIVLQNCIISKSILSCKPDNVPIPAMFRIHTGLLNVKKKKQEKSSKTSDKESGTEAEKEKLPGKRKKKLQEVPKQGKERSEANDQRLPLKKRHRHISSAVLTPADPPKYDGSKIEAFKHSQEKQQITVIEDIKPDDAKGKPMLTKTNIDSLKNIKMETSKSVKNGAQNATCLDITEKLNFIDLEVNESHTCSSYDKIRINSDEATAGRVTMIADGLSESVTVTTPKKRHRLVVDMKDPPSSDISFSFNQNNLTAQTNLKATAITGNELKVVDTENFVKDSVIDTGTDCKLDSDFKPQVLKEKIVENSLKSSSIEEPIINSIAVVSLSRVDEGTHSDSDIPSEHEPLCESDQSGFMSDKEGPKELLKLSEKRKKLRKHFISMKSQSLVHGNDSSIKKKVKRRKTNRTGFPTIRKKKKKPKVENENDLYDVKEENFLIANQLKKRKMEGDDKILPPRPRGRPKKMNSGRSRDINIRKTNDSKEDLKKTEANENEIQNLKNILEKVVNGVRCKTRNKRDLSEESIKAGNLLSIKKHKKYFDDEIDDSDNNIILSESQVSSEPASSDESSRSMNERKKVPRWRKKFLVAGLLSDYYKQDEPPRRNGDATMNKTKILTYNPEDFPHKLLPPPSYCRKLLRETQVDFALPYDLWWLHTHNMLPGRDLVPSWNYKRVKSNVYYDVKPNHDFEVQACNCKRSQNTEEKGCGDDCINRMMFIECTPQVCPISEVCSNQRIQRHESKCHLERFMTADKGWGVKTNEILGMGAFILEYVGEVVSEKEFKHRMQTRYCKDKHHYCLNLDRGMVIDGHRIGGDCRFVNHSCDPNCEMQKWFVHGQYRMALFALLDVDKDEELTYDYNFSLFNPTEGQTCKCGSDNCRGVIGGRSQRINGFEEKKKSTGRNKKDTKRKRGLSTDTEASCLQRSQLVPIKPLSHQQKLFILAHRCFLLRNLEKVRRSRDKLNKYPETKKPDVLIQPVEEPENKIEKFLTHFTALNTARSVKTRRLAQAEDDPQMTRVAKLAQIFKDIYDKLVASRDAKEKPLATPFMNLPSKKKYPSYYARVGEPIDLTLIEKNILTGHYISAEVFDQDIMRLFANNLRFYGRNTDTGRMAVGLRKVYSECKLQFKPFLEEVIGEEHLPQAFIDCTSLEDLEDEDVIRCVCNLYRDEGMMIQCERCLVWQHCDCMGVAESDSPDHYLCEECSPRIVSPEVPMIPQPVDSPIDHKFFITLLRDNLQIKQGDSVYILRDRPSQKTGERRQAAYKLAKDIKPHELLIFKVENLWIDEKGDKFAFGHHYLRPHETFHEPWRKFFPNEVIRSPHCEILPLDMVVNHCWVLDLNTYCRGRPIIAVEDHVYVCEFRVDKIARVFSKISKPKYLICTKPYAFISFPTKLKPQRTYTPHEVSLTGRIKKMKEVLAIQVKEEVSKEDIDPSVLAPSSNNSRGSSMTRKSQSQDRAASESASQVSIQETQLSQSKMKPLNAQREKRRLRVNKVATKLLHQLPSKGAVDLSFLLENSKRQRKKTAAFFS